MTLPLFKVTAEDGTEKYVTVFQELVDRFKGWAKDLGVKIEEAEEPKNVSCRDDLERVMRGEKRAPCFCPPYAGTGDAVVPSVSCPRHGTNGVAKDTI